MDEKRLETGKPPSRLDVARPFLAIGLVVLVFVAAKSSGLIDGIDADRVRAGVEAAGAWGHLLYLGMFCASQLAQVPGLIFIAAALLLWGPLTGLVLAYVGALLAVSAGFLFFRAIGGRGARHVKWPLARRILARLDARPVSSVALLRLVTLLAPPVTFALALSDLRFRHYVLGSLLGLIPPILAATALFELIG